MLLEVLVLLGEDVRHASGEVLVHEGHQLEVLGDGFFAGVVAFVDVISVVDDVLDFHREDLHEVQEFFTLHNVLHLPLDDVDDTVRGVVCAGEISMQFGVLLNEENGLDGVVVEDEEVGTRHVGFFDLVGGDLGAVIESESSLRQ